MGTESWALLGTTEGEALSLSSACHGAGRRMSRHAAPGAYKDVRAVVDAADQAGLARKLARLSPLICIKG